MALVAVTVPVIDLTANNDSDSDGTMDRERDSIEVIDLTSEIDKAEIVVQSVCPIRKIIETFRKEYMFWNEEESLSMYPPEWTEEAKEQYNLYCLQQVHKHVSAPAFALMKLHPSGYFVPTHMTFDINGNHKITQWHILRMDFGPYYPTRE